MADEIICDVDQAVATITFNRPERLNAINGAMGLALDTTIVRLARDPGVRAIVVTGAGRAFCAGADAEDLADLSGTEGRSFDSPPPGQPAPVLDGLPGAPVAP